MTDIAQTASCGACRFYHADKGQCRLHAPIFSDACGSVFPENLSAADWCGDFQSRDGFGWRYPSDVIREPEECPF